jgi:hypothetical protein
VHPEALQQLQQRVLCLLPRLQGCACLLCSGGETAFESACTQFCTSCTAAQTYSMTYSPAQRTHSSLECRSQVTLR